MNKKHPLRFLRGWLSTVRGTAAAVLFVLAVFVGMHLLGQGRMRELGYSLLLIGLGVCVGMVRSFSRYASRQWRLWDALEHQPPDGAALPMGATEPERCYRELALGYQQTQLDQAQRVTAEERERLDYFTLWVHQIKTPISALDLIAQSEEPVDRELLRQEVFKIGQYVDAALSYQRLQSLHSDLELTAVPLYPLCCAVVKKLRPLFLYRNISLRMAPFSGEALSDPKWLGMALSQVLTNALKYTPSGGSITVSQPEPLLLEVRDTGVGISAEDLPRVFECGFTGRLGRTGSSPEKSTGIGLYLCKQALDKLGHRISITSPPEGGVRAVFDLRREQFETFS